MKAKHIFTILSLSALITVSIGITTNTAGIFFTPVADTFGVGKGAVAMALTLCNLAFAAGGMMVVKTLDKLGFKKLVLIFGAIYVASTAALSIAVNLPMLYAFNVIRGFSAGVFGIVLVTMVINNWFYTANAIITAVIIGFSGISGAILSPVFSAVIQSGGWRFAYIVTAMISAVLILPAIVLPTDFHPHTVNAEAFGSAPETDETKSTSSAPLALLPVILILIYAFASSYITAIPQHLPSLAESYELGTGALLLSVCLFANTGGKILLGTLIDILGAAKAMMMYACLIFAGLLMALFVHADAGMIVSAALIGLSYSMSTVGNAMICRETFGMNNYAAIYPKAAMIATVGNALGSSIIGFMYDMSSGYATSLVSLTVLDSIVIVIIVVTMFRRAD